MEGKTVDRVDRDAEKKEAERREREKEAIAEMAGKAPEEEPDEE